RSLEGPGECYAEALSYFPEPKEFGLGPDEYLYQLRRIKERVAVPVIASLNGTTDGGWLRYARLIEQAGAGGLELNLYEVAGNPASRWSGGLSRWCVPSRTRCRSRWPSSCRRSTRLWPTSRAGSTGWGWKPSSCSTASTNPTWTQSSWRRCAWSTFRTRPSYC